MEGETPSAIKAVKPCKALYGGSPEERSAELSIMTVNFMDFRSDHSESSSINLD